MNSLGDGRNATAPSEGKLISRRILGIAAALAAAPFLALAFLFITDVLLADNYQWESPSISDILYGSMLGVMGLLVYSFPLLIIGVVCGAIAVLIESSGYYSRWPFMACGAFAGGGFMALLAMDGGISFDEWPLMAAGACAGAVCGWIYWRVALASVMPHLARRLNPRLRSILVVGFAFVLTYAAGAFLWLMEQESANPQVSGVPLSEIIEIDPTRVQPEYEGRMVRLYGELKADPPLRDPDLGAAPPALRLERTVEMLQWQEREARNSGAEQTGVSNASGSAADDGAEQDRYILVWSEQPIDSSQFEEPDRHTNPPELPLRSQQFEAQRLKLGAFEIDSVVWQRPEFESGGMLLLAPQEVALPENLAAVLRPQGDYFTSSDDPEHPKPGDLRIRFRYLPADMVSVVGHQEGARIVPSMAVRGPPDAVEHLLTRHSWPESLIWTVRVFATAMLWAGLTLLLQPLLSRWTRGKAKFAALLVIGATAALLVALAVSTGWLVRYPWLFAIALIIATAVALLLQSRRALSAPSSPSDQM